MGSGGVVASARCGFGRGLGFCVVRGFSVLFGSVVQCGVVVVWCGLCRVAGVVEWFVCGGW